jgi:rubrerythrin
VEDARRLLAAHLQAGLSEQERAAIAAAAAAVIDFDAPEMTCPACGFAFATGPKECPDCGLFLG